MRKAVKKEEVYKTWEHHNQKTLDVQGMSEEETLRSVSAWINGFLNIRGLLLSEKKTNLLISRIIIIHSISAHYITNAETTPNEKKFGIANSVEKELYILQSALNLSKSARSLLLGQLLREEMVNLKKIRISTRKAQALAMALGLGRRVKKDADLPSLRSIDALTEAVDKALPSESINFWLRGHKDVEHWYFAECIEIYKDYILGENRNAGFSDSPNANLYRFMLAMVKLFEPCIQDPEKGLRGRIKTALNTPI